MAVFFYGCITLDGYLATKKHELDWLYDTGSPLCSFQLLTSCYPHDSNNQM